jgi:hypothetical protein
VRLDELEALLLSRAPEAEIERAIIRLPLWRRLLAGAENLFTKP